MNVKQSTIPTLFPSSSSSSLHKATKNPQPPQPLKSKEPSNQQAYLKFTDVNLNDEEDLIHQCQDSQRMTITFKQKNSVRVAQALPQDQFRKKEMCGTPSYPTSRLSREDNISSRQSDLPNGQGKQIGPHYQQKKITGKPLMVMQQKNLMLPKGSVSYNNQKAKAKAKKGQKKINDASFNNKKQKHNNLPKPAMLGLQTREPSYKQSIMGVAETNSFLEKRFSEGPSLERKGDDHSTPEMIGDDSESHIKQESDSEYGNQNTQGIINPLYGALKHTNLSIIKKMHLQEGRVQNPNRPAKKTKGSFVTQDHNKEDLAPMSFDKQKYMSVRKQNNQDNYISINQNYQPDQEESDSPKTIFRQYHKVNPNRPMQRQVSVNKPQDTVLATNYSKLEKLNQSNGDCSPRIIPFNLVSHPTAQEEDKSQVIFHEQPLVQKKRIEIQVHQDYSSQGLPPGPLIFNAKAKQKSPSFKSNQNLMVNSAQTPTGASKQQFQSPKVLSNKSASQSDLRSGLKQEENSKKKRTQDVRELSVKRSILAQESKIQPAQRAFIQVTTTVAGPGEQRLLSQAQSQSPKDSGRDRRMFSVDRVAQNQKEQSSVNKANVMSNQSNQVKFKILKDNKQRETQKKKQPFIQRQENKVKHKGAINSNQDAYQVTSNGGGVPPFKLKHPSLKYQQPHSLRENVRSQNRSADKSYLVKHDADESIPMILALQKQNSVQESQMSLLNKFKNFFRKGTLKPNIEDTPNIEIPISNINQEVLSTTNTRSKNINNEIYTDLFSPIMEEKFIIKGTELTEEDQINQAHKNRADYFSRESQTSSKFTCSCPRKESSPYACVTALNWLQSLKLSKEMDLKKMRELYSNLISCGELKTYEEQIEKDLARTFPKCEQFQQKEGQMALKRVLLAFSRYDVTLGYVQGMNFIVGSILYHCSEEIAFWIFVTLIEQFEIRDIFEPGLPGLYKHSHIIDKLIQIHIPDLFIHFQTHKIFVEMYASDWIFCLFSNIIPLDLISDFYNNFFEEGWIYFYKFSLSMLGTFKEKLLEEDEFAGILSHIKFKTPEKGHASDQQLSSPDKSPHSSNKVFVFDETTNTFQKQNHGPPTGTIKTQSRLQKMFGFLLKKQEAVWTRIFNMTFQWRISEEQIKSITQAYKNSIVKKESGQTPRFI